MSSHSDNTVPCADWDGLSDTGTLPSPTTDGVVTLIESIMSPVIGLEEKEGYLDALGKDKHKQAEKDKEDQLSDTENMSLPEGGDAKDEADTVVAKEVDLPEWARNVRRFDGFSTLVTCGGKLVNINGTVYGEGEIYGIPFGNSSGVETIQQGSDLTCQDLARLDMVSGSFGDRNQVVPGRTVMNFSQSPGQDQSASSKTTRLTNHDSFLKHRQICSTSLSLGMDFRSSHQSKVVNLNVQGHGQPSTTHTQTAPLCTGTRSAFGGTSTVGSERVLRGMSAIGAEMSSVGDVMNRTSDLTELAELGKVLIELGKEMRKAEKNSRVQERQ